MFQKTSIETLSDLWTSTVTYFIPLPDSVATDRVSDRHGGLIEETAVQVTTREASAEITAAAVTPLCGRGKPRHRRHDTATSGIIAITISCSG
jgi:hypothetical protein